MTEQLVQSSSTRAVGASERRTRQDVFKIIQESLLTFAETERDKMLLPTNIALVLPLSFSLIAASKQRKSSKRQQIRLFLSVNDFLCLQHVVMATVVSYNGTHSSKN